MNSSPSIDNGSFAPPSSIQRSDSRNNSKLLLQKDKVIESLRLELAEAQLKLVESQNKDGGRLQDVERQLMEARVANARLMEDNESYQLLLQDRTLKGDFATNDFSYSAASANQDALAALEGRASGTSLADELSGVNDDHAPEHDPEQRLLEAELNKVKDQNKALTLYINKIIERLLEHRGFEHILDQSNDFKGAPDTDKDLPPPPPPKPTASGASLLQRAKSMAIGSASTAAPRPKPRPMTFMPSANLPSALSNPDTAPSIPIGLSRTTSTRRSRPMSDQYTNLPGAASIVNAMYKGPSSSDGPLSPSLRSSQNFFLPQGAGNRNSSGGGGGNFPGMKSETSSTSGDSVSFSTTTGGADGLSTPPSQASPPRSVHHEKNSTTFAGNKPRPLRLVQENVEATAAANAARRQSWVGWATSAFGKKEDTSAAAGAGIAEVIRE